MNEPKYTPSNYTRLQRQHGLHIYGIGLQAVADLMSLREKPIKMVKSYQGAKTPCSLIAISVLIKVKFATLINDEYTITDAGLTHLAKLEVAQCLP